MASTTFIAKYVGHCAAECGDPILPGEEILYLVDSDVAHVDCTSTALLDSGSTSSRTVKGPATPTSVCPVHFIILPISGVCDDCA